MKFSKNYEIFHLTEANCPKIVKLEVRVQTSDSPPFETSFGDVVMTLGGAVRNMMPATSQAESGITIQMKIMSIKYVDQQVFFNFRARLNFFPSSLVSHRFEFYTCLNVSLYVKIRAGLVETKHTLFITLRWSKMRLF